MANLAMATVRKMSTVQIKGKLNKGLFDDEKKEAAIAVLKLRGIDTSGFEMVKEVEVPDPIEEEVAESGLQKKAKEAIDFIIEINDEASNLKAGEIVGDTEDGKFTVDQVTQLLDLQNSLKKKEEKDFVEEKEESKEPTLDGGLKPINLMEGLPISVGANQKRKKGAEIPDSLKKVVTEILGSSDSKKEKIIQLATKGLTRSQILSLNFVDPTYVYDLFRELKL